MRRVTCLLYLAGASAQKFYAVAKMASTTPGGSVTGTVTFEQDETDELADTTVTWDMTGLAPNGEHGFHVHQYGDTRVTETLVSMAAHFVPFCDPPKYIEDDEGNEELVGGCANDQKHGLPEDPPNEAGENVRHPGDMGNIEIVAGATSGTKTIGNAKMSLRHTLRSIIGRVVVVHELRDDGGQPYGNAGSPIAFGVIGLGNPQTLGQTANTAQAPTTPAVSKIACNFEPTGLNSVEGYALLTLLEPCEPSSCKARMQANLRGLTAGSEHSFHFHEWGDMTRDFSVPGELGEIYHSQGVDVEEIEVLSNGEAQYDVIFNTRNLVQHVGRSLTVHAGPTSASATIAAAACGLANPLSSLEGQTDQAPSSGGAGPSGGAIALLIIALLFVCVVVGVAVLYYLRKPIPFCGACIYDDDTFSVLPPPPPPKTTTVPPPMAPPPDKV